MALVKFFKLTSLPGTLEPNSFYYIENGAYAESYLTDNAGVAKSLGNSAMIRALANEEIANAAVSSNALEIVADIAARDALVLDANAFVLVLDASADPTVTAGAALYVYQLSTTTFIKVAEYESLDVIVKWADIQGRPTSTVAQIDAAVTASHTHSNKAVLDLISEDAEQQLLFRGSAVTSQWDTLNW